MIQLAKIKLLYDQYYEFGLNANMHLHDNLLHYLTNQHNDSFIWLHCVINFLLEYIRTHIYPHKIKHNYQTSDFDEKTPSWNDSGDIQRTGSKAWPSFL